jgi:hypothetical protein
MRLAYRYNKYTDCLHLTNGSAVNESSLVHSPAALGAYYAQLLFKFVRIFSKFNLNKVEFSILCAIKFFANDRPLLIQRDKVQLIQDKYLELLEHLIEQRNRNCNENLLSMAHILLSFVKLRALDVLSKCHSFAIIGFVRAAHSFLVIINSCFIF